MWWMLAREVLRLRGTITRDRWKVMVDLFFYRDPEEAEKEEQAAKESAQAGMKEEQVVASIMPPSENWAVVDSAPEPVVAPAPYSAPSAEPADWSEQTESWANEASGDWAGATSWSNQ